MAYCANGLLGVMNADLTFFETHVPIVNTMVGVFIAVGWALLIGNCVFQAMKSMLSGLGFDGENPHILLIRTGIFGFLMLASRQICELALSISSKVINLLGIPTNITITNLDESAFSGVGSAGWLLVIIFGLIMMFQIFKLLFEIGERYVVVAVLTFLLPLAFAMGGSKSTHDIFKGWVRMYASMMLMMIFNIVFLKMILSAMSTIPTGVLLIPWLVLIVALAKVARKIDSHIVRIGLNPAVTGDSLGGGFPGFVAYTVARNMISNVSRKSVPPTGGSAASAKPAGASGGPGASSFSGGTSGANGSAPVSSPSSNTAPLGVGSPGFQSKAASRDTVRQNNTADTPAAAEASRTGNMPMHGQQGNSSLKPTLNSGAQTGKHDAHNTGTVRDKSRIVQTGKENSNNKVGSAQNTVNPNIKGQGGQNGTPPIPVADPSAVKNSAQMKHQTMMANKNTLKPGDKNSPAVIPGGKMNPVGSAKQAAGSHTAEAIKSGTPGQTAIQGNKQGVGKQSSVKGNMTNRTNQAINRNTASKGGNGKSQTVINPSAASTPVKNINTAQSPNQQNNAPNVKNISQNTAKNVTQHQKSGMVTNQSRNNHAANSIRQDAPKLVNNRPASANPPGGTRPVNAGSAANARNVSVNRQNTSSPSAPNSGRQQGNPASINTGVKGTPPIKSANNNRTIKPINPDKKPKGGRT